MYTSTKHNKPASRQYLKDNSVVSESSVTHTSLPTSHMYENLLVYLLSHRTLKPGLLPASASCEMTVANWGVEAHPLQRRQ